MDDTLTERANLCVIRTPIPRISASTPAGRLAQGLVEAHEVYSRFPRMGHDNTVRIGYGSKLLVRGLMEIEAELLVARDLGAIEGELAGCGWWKGLSAARKAVVLDVAYALGVEKMLKQAGFIAHLNKEQFDLAAKDIEQLPPSDGWADRAEDDAKIMRTGEMPDE